MAIVVLIILMFGFALVGAGSILIGVGIFAIIKIPNPWLKPLGIIPLIPAIPLIWYGIFGYLGIKTAFAILEHGLY